MNEETLQNIYNHLHSNNLTDSDYNTWLNNFKMNKEVRENIYNYLLDNDLTDSDYDTWNSNIYRSSQEEEITKLKQQIKDRKSSLLLYYQKDDIFMGLSLTVFFIAFPLRFLYYALKWSFKILKQ